MHNLFRPLVHDIRVLETEEVDLGFQEKIKGTVSCITGDNLGSHWLGGFTINFSSGEYFCRYCLLQRSDFKQMRLQVTL